MRVSFSITQKLLVFVLPLVCLPPAIVGYISYNDSVERVTYLSREQQLLQARSVAQQINHIFQTCMRDLETISDLPLIEDYQLAINTSRPEEAALIRRKISKVFKELIGRSTYYSQIRILERNGLACVGVSASGARECPIGDQKPSLSDMTHTSREGIYVSKVIPYSPHPCFVLYFSKTLTNADKEYLGELVIDLNYNKVVDLVRVAGIGEAGYAFMVDDLGRSVAHPQFRPYEYNLSKYADPGLREFVVNMISGETGWKVYHYMGEKAAAYTPIPSIGWSVAVCIPIEEFKKEANVLRKRMIEVVAITLFVAIFAVIVLSYNLLRPVKRLVAGTEQIARGADLDQEIPVKSGDELGTLTRSFNRMVRNLRDTRNELVRSEKLVSLGRLSAGVAHEIRNPLNAMKGAIVHLKRRRSDDPLIQEYTQLILEEISRLNLFVTDFLYLARQAPPKPVPTSINEIVKNVFTLFEERLREKPIEVEMSLDPSLPLLKADPNQMEQVIVNILINAMDAVSEGGHLKVSTAIERNGHEAGSRAKVLIIIEDDGVGIPEKELQSVLDPFFSNKEGGTGLGLPISLGIVESHGGVLKIRSREGEGTTVMIELPIDEAPIEAYGCGD